MLSVIICILLLLWNACEIRLHPLVFRCHVCNREYPTWLLDQPCLCKRKSVSRNAYVTSCFGAMRNNSRSLISSARNVSHNSADGAPSRITSVTNRPRNHLAVQKTRPLPCASRALHCRLQYPSLSCLFKRVVNSTVHCAQLSKRSGSLLLYNSKRK